MNPDETSQQPDPSMPASGGDPKMHPFVVLQPGEQVLCHIKRHPFGILSMYVWAVFAMAAVAALVLFAVPKITDQYASSFSSLPLILYGVCGFVAAMVVLVLLVATVVYWKNEWIVTDDSVTQLTQISLFSRETSQVPMQNLEDVTVDQHGLVQTIFGFGTLRIESAGEKSKFQFPYCPTPNKYARLILETHERFVAKHRLPHNGM
jgi:uncharacterized membrane protein YdbT with pleckstrin-like domain